MYLCGRKEKTASSHSEERTGRQADLNKQESECGEPGLQYTVIDKDKTRCLRCLSHQTSRLFLGYRR